WQFAPKRNALYTTADRLAEFFANEASGGKLGEQMRLSQRPLSIPEKIEPSEQIQPWHIAAGIGVLILIVVIIAALASSTARPTAAASDVCAAPATKAEPP